MLYFFVLTIIPVIYTHAVPSCSAILGDRYHLKFSKVPIDKGRLFGADSKIFTSSEIKSLQHHIKQQTSDREATYIEFFFDNNSGLGMDQQGRDDGGVLLRDVIPATLYESLLSKIEGAIHTSSKKIKGFKPDVAVVRFYLKDSDGGHFHTDYGTTLTSSLIGVQTVFKTNTPPEFNTVLFDKNTLHGFPRSQRGRMLVLLAD